MTAYAMRVRVCINFPLLVFVFCLCLPVTPIVCELASSVDSVCLSLCRCVSIPWVRNACVCVSVVGACVLVCEYKR